MKKNPSLGRSLGFFLRSHWSYHELKREEILTSPRPMNVHFEGVPIGGLGIRFFLQLMLHWIFLSNSRINSSKKWRPTERSLLMIHPYLYLYLHVKEASVWGINLMFAIILGVLSVYSVECPLKIWVPRPVLVLHWDFFSSCSTGITM